MIDAFVTGVAVAVPVTLTIILTHVSSARAREKRLSSIESRITGIEANVEWVKKFITKGKP